LTTPDVAERDEAQAQGLAASEPVAAPADPIGEPAAAEPQADPVQAQAQVKEPSLTRRVMNSSGWVTVSYFFAQGIRFGSNVVLAWMLAPEAFGLMALVTLFMMALQMFSDIGIGPSIIQNDRGDEPRFLNTAWTIQVFRGLALWGISVPVGLLAAQLWNPALAYLLPVAGVAAAIDGFKSTSVFTMNRRLTVGRLTLIDLSKQVLAVVVMIGIAFMLWEGPGTQLPGLTGVWALISGGITGSLVMMILSHKVIPGVRAGFAWDRTAVGELIRFGKWLFLGTVLTFLAGSLDKLMLDPLRGAGALGLYWLAFQLADLPSQLMKKIGNMVGFPALSELWRRDRASFGPKLLRMRFYLVAPITVMLLGMILLLPAVVRLLFPPAYQEMAWMAQAFCIASVAGMLNTSYGHMYLAIGSSLSNLLSIACDLSMKIAFPLIGFYLAGTDGFVAGFMCVAITRYIFDSSIAGWHGLWQPRLDLPVLLLGGAGAALCLLGSNIILNFFWSADAVALEAWWSLIPW
jgi:O-antigen/teichoic acid export membrane protein